MALTREQSLSLMKMRQRQAQQQPPAAAAPKKKGFLETFLETRPVMRPDEETDTALRIASSVSGGKIKPPSQVPVTGPSLKEVGKAGVGFAKGVPKGAVGGVLGLPGEIINIPSTAESIGRIALRRAQESKMPGVVSTGAKLVSALTGGGKVSTEPTIPRLPIGVPEVTAGLFGETTDPAEQIGRFVGEVTAPVGTVLKGGAALTRATIGEVPPAREAIARAFEKRGYVLDPAQLRADRPIKTAGGTTSARVKNEKLATKEATRATGKETEDITREFIASRQEQLGKDYKRIFDRNFVIDTNAARTLVNIAEQEGKIFPAGVGSIRSTVKNILLRWEDALTETQLGEFQTGANVTAPIPGEELQRLRSNLTDLARSETDGLKRRAISELIGEIDNKIIAKSNPDVLPLLKSTNSKYAATSALADGMAQGWVSGGRVDLSRLGDYVAGEVPPMQFGAGTSRHPLYELGYGGRELNLTSRAAGQQIPGSEVAQAVRTPLLFAAKTVGLRSPVARAAQRAVSSKELRRMQTQQAVQATKPRGTP